MAKKRTAAPAAKGKAVKPVHVRASEAACGYVYRYISRNPPSGVLGGYRDMWLAGYRAGRRVTPARRAGKGGN